MASTIESVDKKNDRSHYFSIGGSHHRIHQLSLIKHPNSLFKELIDANPENSPINRIKINRPSRHFKTVLDLMRYGNIIYARHLRREKDITELLQELEFYRLHDLGRLVEGSMILRRDVVPQRVVSIHEDMAKYICDLSRPLVVLDESTLRGLKEMLIPKIDPSLIGPGGIGPDQRQLLTPCAFLSLFNNALYDIRVSTDGLTGVTFSKDQTDSRHRGVVQLRFYVPGPRPNLKLAVDEYYTTPVQFRTLICKFLLAAEIVINYAPEYQKDKLSELKDIRFNSDTNINAP